MKKLFFCFLLLTIVCKINAQEVFIKNNKYGIKDSLGVVITKAKYDHIDDFNAVITITKLKDKYGIINIKGKEVSPPIYQEIKPINFLISFVDVQLDGKWGVLDLQGNVLVIPKYADPVGIYFSEYTVVSLTTVVSTGKENKVYGVIDNTSFKEIISPKYFFLKDIGFGYLKVIKDEKNKKYGLIDVNEKVIFDNKYDDISAISKNIISYKKNNKWVLVNSKGYSISSTEYENIFGLYENRAKVKRNGKFGFIDEKGKEVIECKYNETDALFFNGKVKVILNGIRLEIDSNGNEITVSETIKPRDSLTFFDENDEKAFNLINFKENVSNSENLKFVDNYLEISERTGGYKSTILSVDNLMSEAANNKSAYKEFTSYLYNKYIKSNYSCYDAIPIYVAQNYICNSNAPYGGAYWLETKNKNEICGNANKIKPSLCNEIISNVSLKLLPQTSSNYLNLYNLKSKYTLLLFWRNECPYCKEQIQVLVSNYEELKKIGLVIIGISTDEKDKDKSEQLIVANNMDWINTVDINHAFSKMLNINSVPYLFLLDNDKRIIIKAISAEQVIDFLNSAK